MSTDKIINLNETLLIGKGKQKDVYIHPEDTARCIRINTRSAHDHCREMGYRKSRKQRNCPESSLLVRYYGPVETNLGMGFVFERVMDYDGAASKTINELLKLETKAREGKQSVRELLKSGKEYPLVTEVLFRLREEFFKENIIIHDLRPTNCMVQFDTPADWRIRIVDGIGSPTLLPVVYYVDFLGRSHARREWVKLIRRIVQYFPVFFTDEELCELMEIR